MPGLNGLQVQQALAVTGIAVIFTSSVDDVGARRAALAAGAIAWLDKPYDGNFLVKPVRVALSAGTEK